MSCGAFDVIICKIEMQRLFSVEEIFHYPLIKICKRSLNALRMEITYFKFILCFILKYKLKSTVYTILLSIDLKNTEFQYLLNVKITLFRTRFRWKIIFHFILFAIKLL